MAKRILKILLPACLLLAGCGNNEQNQDMLVSNITEGNFSEVAESSLVSKEELQRAFNNLDQNTEWEYRDLNGDGSKDLIWLDNTAADTRIVGIFDMRNDATCVYWDTMDQTEFFFITNNDNLVRYSQYFGFYDYVAYEHYSFDENWNENIVEGTYAYNIYEPEIPYWLDEHNHDNMDEIGTYFKHYIDGVETSITKKDFTVLYEKLTGNEYQSIENNSDLFWLNEEITEEATQIEETQSELPVHTFPDIAEICLCSPKGDIPERSYDSFCDFPHENMDYVDDETYAFLQDVYETIDFYGEIKTCDLAEYGDYIKKFKELLNNQVPFYDPETGECVFVKDYVDMYGMFLTLNADVDTYNPHGFLYYVFDMDGDGTPELCMYNFKTHIFKYEEETDSIILWKSIQTSYETIQGTRLLRWNWGGLRYTLCELDENAELAKGVLFLIYPYSDNAISHLVTVPKYFDESKQILITDKMKEQAYFCEEYEVYMFNVTEEQFDKLTEDFFKAGEQSEEQMKDVCYSYDDLFNEGVDCETCRKNEEFWIK